MASKADRTIGASDQNWDQFAPNDTRRRILMEASALFRRHGYQATSTRQIAAAVGIRQPSLFHHFANKQAILEALFSLSLDNAVVVAERTANASGSAAARLHDYLVWDLETLLSLPLSLSELYSSDILRAPELAHWAAKLESLYLALEKLVRQGIEAGEFVATDPVLIRILIANVTIAHIQYADERPDRDPKKLARDGARFVLAGLSNMESAHLDELISGTRSR
ncbi:TetR/AcrR family transcriptional regulator [Mesorhizobium sp. M4B.F.Ca.ET.215.01.1.1]|uniref:TetR/AcrR family transcriptional regulator n=1 Tax=Mesorhizobium abyssinicae TaxID=1209958 RepID=A0ABU5AQI4_9HYPH|nr:MULTISPECIES: TetR/AcrR family transcriptional regulator [Mesorhizobium]MDX8539545.1 TetR/AcrR family transcriptional regulator [Mesorhizobium abyssinicae]RUW24974.1 TetR/AcrR family transcriptional regulator [Mesorhizobium sp. M4B.F.Ca.ET.013.02.1.1]RVD36201.1 TetR/AcrR family transcriptional regulator [Mesorhizobium sp. M4B.F.Ca.ET.019.03.1.1]RWF61964.1 MAG: TetR/AcrR family transcriptional regulator [Mesorhizobium sp.]TGQ14253.1 TetR/AcrR family transcriptional regulator [Mesorhizobium s